MFISQQTEFLNLPSPYWGDKPLWGSQTTPHNPMFDHKGRVWFTSRIREARRRRRSAARAPSIRPRSCSRSSRPGRQLSVYDPKTGKLTLIDTCFTTHHLNFAEDENHTLWLSAGGFRAGYVGWFNTKLFDETGDEQRAQGWSPIILDTNGNGRRDEGYVGPNDPVDPTKDKHIVAGLYAIAYNPVDKSIWGTVQVYPGGDRAHHARRQSAGDRAGGILRGAVPGLRPARRRHRPQRRLLDARSRAATSANSTGASARARSTARPRPAGIVRRAGRSTRFPARNSRT